MSEQEGFNAVWLPLPPRAQRLMLQEDARELREARQAGNGAGQRVRGLTPCVWTFSSLAYGFGH